MKGWPARQPVGMVSPGSVLQSDTSALLVRTHAGGSPPSCPPHALSHVRPHIPSTSGLTLPLHLPPHRIL